MENIYINGGYFENSPSWHIEDSPWKAQQIIKIMEKNQIKPKTICEVGCGAGEILNQLYQKYSSEISYFGYDISPQAYELCKLKENEHIHFFLKDICTDKNSFYDVLLLIDVIEHVGDLYSFLKIVKDKSEYKIFHIPLDMFVLNILEGETITKGLRHPGHIHFFTKDIVLEMLRINDFEILDNFYTPWFESFGTTISSKILRYPRKIMYKINADLGSKILGGVSLLVLTK